MKNKIILGIFLFLAAIVFIIFKTNNYPPFNKVIKESSNEDILIEKYLNTHVLIPEYDGSIFCVFNKYGSEEKDNQIFYYLWVYCEEYYKNGKEILMGSGVSMPIRLNAIRDENQIKIENYKQPIDGEDYPKSIKEIFPEKYSSDAINGFDITNFSKTPKEKADQYFKN